jgi:hypothetical protein
MGLLLLLLLARAALRDTTTRVVTMDPREVVFSVGKLRPTLERTAQSDH